MDRLSGGGEQAIPVEIMAPVLLTIAGSSCSGKTTAARACAGVRRLVVHDFDETGVPSTADIRWRHRSMDAWLRRVLGYQDDVRLRATSMIMSSWPPTRPRRPASTRIDRTSTPYRWEAASAWRRNEPQQRGQAGAGDVRGRRLDPVPVGVAAWTVGEAATGEAVAVGDLDAVDPRGVERRRDPRHVVGADPVAYSVHAVPQRHVLDEQQGVQPTRRDNGGVETMPQVGCGSPRMSCTEIAGAKSANSRHGGSATGAPWWPRRGEASASLSHRA